MANTTSSFYTFSKALGRVGDLTVDRLNATGSIHGTASYVSFNNIGNTPALVSSSAQFDSADNVVFNQVTASVINVDILHVSTVSASVEYSSGSNVFGSSQTNTHKFTGSVQVTGSITATSFVGTASWASTVISASYAPVASNIFTLGGNSFGATASIGTNDANPISIETDGVQTARFERNGDLFIGSGAHLESPALLGRGIFNQRINGQSGFYATSVTDLGGTTTSAQFIGSVAAGTPSAMLPAYSGSSAVFIMRGWTGNVWTGGGAINIGPTQTWSTGSAAANIKFTTVPSGSTTQVEVMRLEDNGDVEIGGPWIGQSTLSGRGVFLQRSTANAQYTVLAASGSVGAAPSVFVGFEGSVAGGSLSSLTPSYSGSGTVFALRGFDGAAWSGGSRVTLAPTQTWSAGSHGSMITFNTVRSGSSANGGIEVMRIADNGNVGIGCSAPSASLVVSENSEYATPITGTSLHVVGADGPNAPTRIAIDSAGNGTGDYSGIVFRRTRGNLTTPTVLLAEDTIATINAMGTNTVGALGTNSNAGIAFKAAQNFSAGSAAAYMTFYTAASGSATNAERLRIDSNGNVGIGSATPSARLVVQNNATASAQAGAIFQIVGPDSSGTPTVGIFDSAGNGAFDYSQLLFRRSRGTQAAPTPLQAGDSVGNMSFRGTSVSGSFGNAGAGGIVVAAQLGWNAGSTPSYMTIYTTPSGSIGAVERMRIDSSGNVGVGTTAPQAVLHVTGSLRLDVVSTTGANTATLTNAPVSGNPAGWARVNINGVARVIPYW